MDDAMDNDDVIEDRESAEIERLMVGFVYTSSSRSQVEEGIEKSGSS
jgi:hypothetical protein